ncbi:hypothetical protein [Streptomyces sp900105755]|uniref:Uncharacterized protein n=1 Tax=Streptomyces sp. 900105755 TaxID=3154389 RepID=A0ABV1TE82_9ACTN
MRAGAQDEFQCPSAGAVRRRKDDQIFLASPEASYVTAEVVNATGGSPLP